MAYHKAEWWQKRVEELSAGGDAEAIAHRHGVQVKTLHWWRSELVRRAQRKGSEGAAFLPVVVNTSAGQRESAAGDLEIVLESGAARVSIRGGVSVGHLESIVRSLFERC